MEIQGPCDGISVSFIEVHYGEFRALDFRRENFVKFVKLMVVWPCRCAPKHFLTVTDFAKTIAVLNSLLVLVIATPAKFTFGWSLS